MMWALIFVAWLVVALLWRRYSFAGSQGAALLSTLVVGLLVTWAFGVYAGAVLGIWAWRIPKLWAEMQASRVQRRRRELSFSLITVLANGAATGKPAWTTLRDAAPKLPPEIGSEVKTIVATAHVRPRYTVADGLEALGQRWQVPEIEIAGNIVRAAQVVGAKGVKDAFSRLIDELLARTRHHATVRKESAQNITVASVLVLVLAALLAVVLVNPGTRHFFGGTMQGQIIMGVASVAIVWGLSGFEKVWRRLEAVAGAAL